jgi:hypothetical protein
MENQLTVRDEATVFLERPHPSPAGCLRVRSGLDENAYPAGRIVSDADMETLYLRPDAFHGEWNCSLLPRLMFPQA